MDMTAIALTLASTHGVGPSPSAQENEATVVPWTLPLVRETNPSPPQAENRTAATTASRPSKSDTITSSSHHPVSSASSLESESFTQPPPTSSSTLSHVTHKPSGHSTARSSVFVTSGPRAVPEGSSPTPRKLPQSSFVSPKSVTTVKSASSCPAVASAFSTSNTSHVSMSHGLPPSTGHGLLSEVSCAPTKVSPITATSLTRGIATPLSSGTSGTFQGTHTTITSTVIETPDSTFPTPVSVTEMVVGRLTLSAPSFVTSAELTTLADGTVVSVTQVIANPAQDASGSLARHSFFEDHLLVISIFLVSGMAIAFILALALIYCRRRRRQRQRRQRKLEDISAPLPQNPVTMREHASPLGGLDGGSVGRLGDQPGLTRSSSSIPLNRGKESMPATNGIIDTPPLPPPPSLQQQQRVRHRLSYRVPVPYAGLGTHYMGPSSDNLPEQGVQKNPTSSLPPPPPKRSPLRLLASKNDPKPQEHTQRLSGASSLSIYPPSSYPSEAEVDSLYKRETGAFQSQDTSDSSTRGPSSDNNSGMGQRKEKASKNNQFTDLNSLGSWKWGIQP